MGCPGTKRYHRKSLALQNLLNGNQPKVFFSEFGQSTSLIQKYILKYSELILVLKCIYFVGMTFYNIKMVKIYE